MKQANNFTRFEGDGQRILVRCYDTKVLSPRLARTIRTVTDSTTWEAWQIAAGIVAGHNEICLMTTPTSEQADAIIRELQMVGFMVRTEPVTKPGLTPGRPGRVDVLRGLATIRLDR